MIKINQPEDNIMQEAQEKDPLWLIIWNKEWRTIDWLATSMVSSVLISEMYQIIASVYPLFLSHLWLHLGINSILIVGFLNFGTWVMLSLALGWAIYSLHLASRSIHTFENDYQPLIDLWTIQNPIPDEIIKKLITKENFVTLAQWLNNEEIPQVIKDYLQNADNCNHISKVISLLQLIFENENPDTKFKNFFIELFNHPNADENQVERIEHICELALFLWDGKLHESEDFYKILEKNADYSNYLPQLELAQSNGDLLQILLETPSLMKFYASSLELYPNQPNESLTLIKSLASYMREEYPLPIKRDIFIWLFSAYKERPAEWLPIWKKLCTHPNIESLQNVLEKIMVHPNAINHISEVLELQHPDESMLPGIEIFLTFNIPCQSLESCEHLDLLQRSMKAYLEATQSPTQTELLKIRDNIGMIHDKLQKNPNNLSNIIHQLLKPKSPTFFANWTKNKSNATSINVINK